MKIEIYTTPTCGYCVKSKELVKSLGMEYTEHAINAETSNAVIADLTARMGTPPTAVPQIFIDDVYIGGFLQLSQWASTQTA